MAIHWTLFSRTPPLTAELAPSRPPRPPGAAGVAELAPPRPGGRRAGGGGECAAHDLLDFTTWIPETWDQLDFSQFTFPTDSCISICSVRSYQAVAMLFWHIHSLSTAHSRVWDDLQYAWHAAFHTELSGTVLEKWHTKGPHAFSADAAHWLTETLRHLKNLKPGPALRRRVTQPPLRLRLHTLPLENQRRPRIAGIPIQWRTHSK